MHIHARLSDRRCGSKAKYSSEKERIWAPSTDVVRFVEEENVLSIRTAGTDKVPMLEEIGLGIVSNTASVAS